MTMICKVRFLTVIWGERYVEEFAAVSLPSYLASGNLPALAGATDLEVLVLTSEESLSAFNKSPAFRRLHEVCPVRFILIDDLIAEGCYGVTLTLAYARGIRSMGAAQTDTYFVFMNSDFVLADGSLRHLAGLMEEGRPCIMAASLRGRAEAILPELRKAVSDDTHQLVMPSREMVALTLANLHATVVAKDMTQSTMSCLTHNQLYWRIDGKTLLGRSYLIFMLAIRPEVPMGPVNSYCDYGFVPELVPSGKRHIIGDSDDFFMLELQPTEQEMGYLTYGTVTPGDMARELSTWTTAEHRRFAQRDTVFHAGDLPPVLDYYRTWATDLVKDLNARMGEPKAHADHVFWTMGLRSWWSRRQLRDARPVSYDKALADALRAKARAPSGGVPLPRAFPEELLWRPFGFRLSRPMQDIYLRLVGALRARQGVFPHLSAWHPRWPDAHMLTSWINDSPRGAGRVRLVDLGDGGLARALENEPRVERSFPANWKALTMDAPDEILVCLPTSEVNDAAKIQWIEHVLECIGPGGRLGIFVYHPGQLGFIGGPSAALATMLSQRMPTHDIDLAMIDGRIRGSLLRIEHWCRRHIWSHTPLVTPIAIALWPAVSLLLSLGNRWRWSEPRKEPTANCTSMMLTLRRRTGMATLPAPKSISTKECT